ncbi:hypothetical protein SPPR111872_00340 [Sphingobacterium prati]
MRESQSKRMKLTKLTASRNQSYFQTNTLALQLNNLES